MEDPVKRSRYDTIYYPDIKNQEKQKRHKMLSGRFEKEKRKWKFPARLKEHETTTLVEVFNPEETENWTNSLANLTLLSLRKNVQAQNYSFSQKKNAYANIDNVISSFVITQEILKEEDWNVASLERRKMDLTEKIYNKTLVF